MELESAEQSITLSAPWNSTFSFFIIDDVGIVPTWVCSRGFVFEEKDSLVIVAAGDLKLGTWRFILFGRCRCFLLSNLHTSRTYNRIDVGPVCGIWQSKIGRTHCNLQRILFLLRCFALQDHWRDGMETSFLLELLSKRDRTQMLVEFREA